jgi:hypothetical protein
MFEKSIAIAADRSDGLHARSEGPFEQSVDPGGAPIDGNLDAAAGRRIGVFDARPFAERLRRQVRSEGSIRGRTERRGVV